MNTIDLNNPPPNHKFDVSIARDETQAERHVRLFKDVALFVVALGFVVLVVWLCYSTLAAPAATAEEKKWAMSVIHSAARHPQGMKLGGRHGPRRVAQGSGLY